MSADAFLGAAATIVSVFVGGLIAAATQWLFLRSQRKQQEQALATSLLLKLGQLADNIEAIKRHLDECLAQGQDAPPDTELWQLVTPIINPPDAITFTTDELSMLLAQANDDLFQRVWGLDNSHNAIMLALRRFDSGRATLSQRLHEIATLEERNGNDVTIGYDRRRADPLIPQMIELNSIVLNSHKRTTREAEKALRAVLDAGKFLKQKLRLKFSPQRVKQYDRSVK